MIKSGMARKAVQGEFPGCAPLGYINVRRTLREAYIEIDPVTAPLVKQAFQLTAQKRTSLRKVLASVTAMGLRSRNGNRIQVSAFHRILTNPFYVGELRFNGKIFHASHKPLVSRQLFDDVQKQLKSRRKAPEDF